MIFQKGVVSIFLLFGFRVIDRLVNVSSLITDTMPRESTSQGMQGKMPQFSF